MTATFESAKVGDRVWCIRSGWGEIRGIYPTERYSISVYFPNAEYGSYTLDGLFFEDDMQQTLFWDEVVIEAPVKPLPELEVDTKLVVWRDGGHKSNRHFSHFDHRGVIHTFADGRTSFTGSGSTVPWTNWELAE